MLYQYKCLICSKTFEEVQKMNDKHIAYHCGIEAQRIWSIPYTDRDLAYQFTDTTNFKQGYDIHSRRQFKKLCKEHKLVPLTKEERKSIKPPSLKDLQPKRRETAKKMAAQLAKDGLGNQVKDWADKFVIKKEK